MRMICNSNLKVQLNLFLILIFIVFTSLTTIAQESSKSTVITNVRLFDGEKVISLRDVIIQDGKIIKVGKSVSVPEGAKVIDGTGKTLLPGLIDAHVHVASQQHLKQYLVFGVTTVVDMSMSIDLMKEIKKLQASGKANDMAGLISAGTLVTAPGGHGTEYGLSIPTISKPEESQAFVDARIAEGSDFIKIIYDDGSQYSINWPTLDKETIAAVIQAAHKRNKLAVVHIAKLQEAKMVIEANANGLAHLFSNDDFDPEFGKFVAKHKAFVIPTFSVLESLSGASGAPSLIEDRSLSPYLNQRDITNLQQLFPVKLGRAGYEAAEKALQQLKREGVPILAGTDTPNPGTTPGASLHRELDLLVEAGLTPMEALKAGTATPAKIFNIENRGRIQSGFIADLLLVNGDPTEDIKVTRDIAAIWKNGVKVDRKMYREAVEKEKAEMERQKAAPSPPGSESGLISDFEDEEIKAKFGSGWSVSTDAMMGGKSTAEFKRIEGGVQGSKGSMLITGNIGEGSTYKWAGAFFSPGSAMMAPANLSSKKAMSFWTKGDGKTYLIMIFAQSLGWQPAIKTFKTGIEWNQYTFPFEDFGTDAHDLMGIFFGGGLDIGEFTFQIDNVRLE